MKEYCAEINLAGPSPCEAAIYNAEMMNRRRGEEIEAGLGWLYSPLQNYRAINCGLSPHPSSPGGTYRWRLLLMDHFITLNKQSPPLLTSI